MDLRMTMGDGDEGLCLLFVSITVEQQDEEAG
jgi:hypothetical protein